MSFKTHELKFESTTPLPGCKMLRVFLVFHTYRCRLAIYGACGASELFFWGGVCFIANRLPYRTAGRCLICPFRQG